MLELLEDLKDQLKQENRHFEYLRARMLTDIQDNDFNHLSKLAAEASESKGKIEILKSTIKQIEEMGSVL